MSITNRTFALAYLASQS